MTERRSPWSRGAGFPTPAQELLLRVAVGPTSEARAAWERWSTTVDLETVESASHRLLPLAYLKLSALGVAHPWLGRLKGVYKASWYRNQIALRDLSQVLQILGESRITPFVVKGAALTSLYYKNVGARPMDDVDVAVHPRDAVAAFEALRAHGWTTWTDEPERYLEVFHALNFTGPGPTAVDLHWNVLTLSPGIRAHEALTARAVDFRSGSTTDPAAGQTLVSSRARTLDAAGHLVHALVHGIAWSASVGIRWVADAVVICESEAVDWERVAALARTLDASLPVRSGLRYLRERFRVKVPRATLDALAEVRPSGLEAAFHRLHRRDRSRSVSAAVLYSLLEHAWRTRAQPVRRRIALLPRFLQLKLQSPSLAALPRSFHARARARVKGSGSRPFPVR